MDTAFFFKVWDIYQIYWGRQEQQELKKRRSARLLENLLRNSPRMKGLYHMHPILRMMWDMNEDGQHQEEIFDAIKTLGKACMGEEDLCDNTLDAYTRMMNDVHVCHHFCYLSVEQRQWMSLRRSHLTYSNVNHDHIYGLSALLVLPYCSL